MTARRWRRPACSHRMSRRWGGRHGDGPDPTRLLEGSGKRMRHVKLRPGVDSNAAALRALIDAAYLDGRARHARVAR
jgi:hypothetical protein